jgi:hypothetical protein
MILLQHSPLHLANAGTQNQKVGRQPEVGAPMFLPLKSLYLVSDGYD